MQFIRRNGETAGGRTSIIGGAARRRCPHETLELVFKYVAGLLLLSIIGTLICATLMSKFMKAQKASAKFFFS